MPTLDSQILTDFLARIEESDRVDNSLVQGLRDVLSSERLRRLTDLVRLYAAAATGRQRMIQVEAILVEDFRGVRRLDLQPG